MKFAFAFFIIFVSLRTHAAPPELTSKADFVSPKVVMDNKKVNQVSRSFDLEGRMPAESKKRSTWDQGLREKLQGAGAMPTQKLTSF